MLEAVAVVQVHSVPAAEAQPGAAPGRVAHEAQQHLGLDSRGHGLARQQIRPGAGQYVPARLMERAQLTGVDSVIARILRSIGQERPVGTDARRHEWAQAAAPVREVRPERIARVGGEVDGAYQESGGLVPVEAACRESGEAGLIGARRDAVGARLEEGTMDVADGVGIFEQHLGGPERMVHVVPPRLEGRGQSAVEHDHALPSNERDEGVHAADRVLGSAVRAAGTGGRLWRSPRAAVQRKAGRPLLGSGPPFVVGHWGPETTRASGRSLRPGPSRPPPH